jgi:hypothetical protein
MEHHHPSVTHDIKTIYSMTRVNLVDRLKVHVRIFFNSPLPCKPDPLKQTKRAIHLMLDVCTDINMTTWLRITLYVVQEHGYKKIPLDFIQ